MSSGSAGNWDGGEEGGRKKCDAFTHSVPRAVRGVVLHNEAVDELLHYVTCIE